MFQVNDSRNIYWAPALSQALFYVFEIYQQQQQQTPFPSWSLYSIMSMGVNIKK